MREAVKPSVEWSGNECRSHPAAGLYAAPGEFQRRGAFVGAQPPGGIPTKDLRHMVIARAPGDRASCLICPAARGEPNLAPTWLLIVCAQSLVYNCKQPGHCYARSTSNAWLKDCATRRLPPCPQWGSSPCAALPTQGCIHHTCSAAGRAEKLFVSSEQCARTCAACRHAAPPRGLCPRRHRELQGARRPSKRGRCLLQGRLPDRVV